MRLKTFTLFILVWASQHVSLVAQTRGDLFSDSYATNQGWTQVNTKVTVTDGAVKAEKADADLTPRRVYKALASSLKNAENWKLETDFTDRTASGEYSVYDLVALTTDNFDPHVICSSPTYGCSFTERPENNIMIRAGKPADNSKVHIYLKINNIGTTEPVNIESFVTYYISLEKRDSVYTLTLFLDAARTIPAPNFPVTLKSKTPLPDFKYLQHAVSTTGGNFRISSFTIDNTYLTSVPKVITSLSETTFINKLKVTPNPARDHISLLADGTEAEQVELFTTQGQLVLQSNKTSTIDINALPKGSYIVKVHNGASVFIEKLVVE